MDRDGLLLSCFESISEGTKVRTAILMAKIQLLSSKFFQMNRLLYKFQIFRIRI